MESRCWKPPQRTPFVMATVAPKLRGSFCGSTEVFWSSKGLREGIRVAAEVADIGASRSTEPWSEASRELA